MSKRIKNLTFALLFTLCLSFPSVASASEDNLLSIEEASSVAFSFINTVIEMNDTSWNENTCISDYTILHDIDDNVSAYSFELTTLEQNTGYIIIAAHLDTPNLILEYTDSAEPLYYELNVSDESNIVYVGAFGYYEDIGNNQVQDLNNDIIESSSVENTLEESRDIEYIEENTEIIENAQDNIEVFSVSENNEVDSNEIFDEAIITDPVHWANSHYDGPFVNYEWRNIFENHVPFRTTSDFPNYNNHCGPTAITNLIETIGSYKRISSINNKTYLSIFKTVATYGQNNNYFSNRSGSSWNTLNQYIKGSFAQFGVNVTVSSTNNVSYNVVRANINLDRPFYLSLSQHSSYGNHGVVGYAYTRFVSQSTGYYKSFIKIADGWSHSGRYIDLAHISASNSAVLRAVKVN